MSEIDVRKAQLRDVAKRRRAQAVAQAAAVKPQAEAAMGRLLDQSDLVAAGATVAAYLPIGDELDPMSILSDLNPRICLPVMTGKNAPLAFREWQAGNPLVTRKWGIREPDGGAAEARPDVLLVPLLAVDDCGYRLGYGGGFYDRTLALLRADGANVTAIGVALDCQRVEAVPHDAYDQPVDYVLTPGQLVKCSTY